MSNVIYDKNLDHTDKKRLSEFNIEEARGWIIDRFQQIEYRVNSIIVNHFKPDHESDFKKIVLNSSVLDIGSKLKILGNIEGIDKSTIQKIRDLSSIRNGFAHAPMHTYINVNIDTKKTDGIDKSSGSVETKIEVMNAQGIIKVKSAYNHLVEFWKLNKEIRELI